jgi:hypothetical protein
MHSLKISQYIIYHQTKCQAAYRAPASNPLVTERGEGSLSKCSVVTRTIKIVRFKFNGQFRSSHSPSTWSGLSLTTWVLQRSATRDNTCHPQPSSPESDDLQDTRIVLLTNLWCGVLLRLIVHQLAKTFLPFHETRRFTAVFRTGRH